MAWVLNNIIAIAIAVALLMAVAWPSIKKEFDRVHSDGQASAGGSSRRGGSRGRGQPNPSGVGSPATMLLSSTVNPAQGILSDGEFEPDSTPASLGAYLLVSTLVVVLAVRFVGTAWLKVALILGAGGFAGAVLSYIPWGRRTGAWHSEDISHYLSAHFVGRLFRLPGLRRLEEAIQLEEENAVLKFHEASKQMRRRRALHKFAHDGATILRDCLALNESEIFGEGQPGFGTGIAFDLDTMRGEITFRPVYPRGVPHRKVRDAWKELATDGIMAHSLGLTKNQARLVERGGGEVLITRPLQVDGFPAESDDILLNPEDDFDVPVLASLQEAIEEGKFDAISPYRDGLPPLSLLAVERTKKSDNSEMFQQIAKNAAIALQNYTKMRSVPVGCVIGASVLQVLVRVPIGARMNVLNQQEDNLALSLGIPNIRIAPEYNPLPNIQGGNLIGIEIPIQDEAMKGVVYPDAALGSEQVREAKGAIPLLIGLAQSGAPIIGDLTKFPHLLVGGQTNGGKSIFLHSIIAQLLLRFSPSDLRLRLADAKTTELVPYQTVPHLDGKVAFDIGTALPIVNATREEMDRRYAIMRNHEFNDITEYNAVAKKRDWEYLPRIVFIIDEFAEFLVNAKTKEEREEFEDGLQSLAQKARGAGIHLILTTQRPTKDAMPMQVKANLPTSVAFNVKDHNESLVILNEVGAQHLGGRGDLLFKAPGKHTVRAQSPFVKLEVAKRIVDWWKDQLSTGQTKVDAQTQETYAAQLEQHTITAAKAVATMRDMIQWLTDMEQNSGVQIVYNRADFIGIDRTMVVQAARDKFNFDLNKMLDKWMEMGLVARDKSSGGGFTPVYAQRGKTMRMLKIDSAQYEKMQEMLNSGVEIPEVVPLDDGQDGNASAAPASETPPWEEQADGTGSPPPQLQVEENWFDAVEGGTEGQG